MTNHNNSDKTELQNQTSYSCSHHSHSDCDHEHDHTANHKHKHCGCNHAHMSATNNGHKHSHCSCNEHEHTHRHHKGADCGRSHDNKHHHEHHEHANCGCGHHHVHEHHHHGAANPNVPAIDFNVLTISRNADETLRTVYNALVEVRSLPSEENNIIFKSKQSVVKELKKIVANHFNKTDQFNGYHFLGAIFASILTSKSLSDNNVAKSINQFIYNMTEQRFDFLQHSDLYLVAEKIAAFFKEEIVQEDDTFKISNIFQTFLDKNSEDENDSYNLLTAMTDFTYAVVNVGALYYSDLRHTFAEEDSKYAAEDLNNLFDLYVSMNSLETIISQYAASYPQDIDELLKANFNIDQYLVHDSLSFIFLNTILTYESFAKGLAYPQNAYDLTSFFLINLF